MLLATYGTFREGQALSHYLDNLREIGTTEVVELAGVKLFVLGAAPGAKITGDPNDKAVVELIEADTFDNETRAVLEVLDYVEGVAQGMYERSSIDTPRGEAIIYTKCGNTEGCTEITDWMEWQQRGFKEKEEALHKAQTYSQAIHV